MKRNIVLVCSLKMYFKFSKSKVFRRKNSITRNIKREWGKIQNKWVYINHIIYTVQVYDCCELTSLGEESLVNIGIYIEYVYLCYTGRNGNSNNDWARWHLMTFHNTFICSILQVDQKLRLNLSLFRLLFLECTWATHRIKRSNEPTLYLA